MTGVTGAGTAMVVRDVRIDSDGLRLAGSLHLPAGEAGAPRPAVIVLHGFGGSRNGKTHRMEAELYAGWGYVVLRIDFRGCGESEGERGRILCADAVADARAALGWLLSQPQVDGRVALSGQSYGGAVAVYAAGVDSRVAATVSIGGWGNGLTKFRGQHRSDEAWARFTAMLEEGARRRARGLDTKVSRWEIVPIPEHLRSNIPRDAIMEFPVEVAQSMVDFCAEDVVADIAPRPLLLLHAAQDSVTPSSQSIEMMRRTGEGAELMLLGGLDHFPFESRESRLASLLHDWLDIYYPLAARAAGVDAEPCDPVKV